MTAQRRAFVEAEKTAGRNVTQACELLEVSRSAFYTWCYVSSAPANARTASPRCAMGAGDSGGYPYSRNGARSLSPS